MRRPAHVRFGLPAACSRVSGVDRRPRRTSNMTVYLALLLSGVASGFLAGLLGIGGGFVMVPVLILLLPMLGIDPGVGGKGGGRNFAGRDGSYRLFSSCRAVSARHARRCLGAAAGSGSGDRRHSRLTTGSSGQRSLGGNGFRDLCGVRCGENAARLAGCTDWRRQSGADRGCTSGATGRSADRHFCIDRRRRRREPHRPVPFIGASQR